MIHDAIDRFADRKLAALERRQLRRELQVADRHGGVELEVDGRTVVSFACNDYLGLARDPQTIAASVAATQRFGTGAGAARLITGNHSLYAELEHRLAALKGTQSAVVFGSGYLTNMGVIPVFAGASDLIVIDELAHSCLLAGARLAGAATLRFRHNDTAQLADLLTAQRASHRHCLVVTEGVFSMDGDLAPLPEIAALARAHGAWLLTDDAHGLGVVGNGRGSTFAHPAAVDVPLQTGTLSKAAGAYGGYLCGSEAVVELVRNRAASFVYSTGLPPGTVAAASAALERIATDAALVARPLALAQHFTAALGLPTARSAIVPIVIGDVGRTLAAAKALRAAGYQVPAIRPPTVPAGSARLRFTFSAAHTDAAVDDLIDAVSGIGLGR